MLNIQEAIRSLIQEELNKNTQGLDFEVSLYNVKTNDLLENTLPISNTYATQQKRFIPVLIEEISGEYADLQNITASETFINASLLIPVDDQDFNNIVVEETYKKVALSMDEMRERINARNLPLGDVTYTLNKDYRLKVLNDTETFASSLIELDIKFWDEEDGMVLTDDSILTLEKQGDQLVFSLDGVNYNKQIDTSKRYIIFIQDLGGNEVKIEVSDGSSTTTEILQNVNYDLDDLILGGTYLEIKRLSVGSTSGFVLDLRDFKNYTFVEGDLTLIDKTNVTPTYELGSIGSIVLGFSIPNPTTNQFTMGNGLNYQQFELNMTGFITDSVFVGNEVKYFLDGVEIFPFFRDESFVSETDPSQVVGQQITKHTATQSALGREYSIYFKNDAKLLKLAEKITSLTPNPNEVFTLKIQYPLFEREYPVIVTQGALGISNNQPISISVKFDLASNILL